MPAQRNSLVANLRVFATLVVVLGHSIIIFDPSWSAIYGYYHSYECQPLHYLKMFINIFQMPLFFAISGFCFFWSFGRISSISKFLKDKAVRLLIPFLMVAFLWMVPLRFAADFAPYQTASLPEIALKILTISDSGHLWFLPVLFVLFALGVLVLQTQKKHPLFPMILVVVLLAIGLFLPGGQLRNILVQYFPFFMLGFWLNKYQWKTRSIKHKAIAFAILPVIAIAAFAVRYKLGFSLAAAGIIVGGCFAGFPSKFTPIMAFLDKNSFGLYLFHCPILYLGMRYFASLAPPQYLVLQLVSSIAISLLLTISLRKLGLHFIIGEKSPKPKPISSETL